MRQLTSLQMCVMAILTNAVTAIDNKTDLPEHLSVTNSTNTRIPTPQATFISLFLFIVFFTCLIDKLCQLEHHLKNNNRFFRERSPNEDNLNKEKQKPLIYRTV